MRVVATKIVAPPLSFPEEALRQHLVALGKTGSGKSSVLRGIAENRIALGRRVCIVDPKGDWWGLKCSPDGKGPGLPVVLFGNFRKADAGAVPINPRCGRQVAELITAGNRPCVIGLCGWMPSEMTKFWIDFASALFALNAGELFLFVDEVHNFAPKGRLMDPDAAKSLHWMNRLMGEGRGAGLVCLVASQRPQKVHNDTLTSCETLVAMRLIHKSDREAVREWIDGCGDGSSGKQVLDTLAGLERGEAWVWSPEIKFGPERVRFPMFSTFDSFAPPQLQREVQASGWEDVDLPDVRAKLSQAIEEAEANDPAKLRAQITMLKARLAAAPIAPPRQIRVEVPVSVLQPEDSANLAEASARLLEAQRSMQGTERLLARVDQGLRVARAKPTSVAVTEPVRVAPVTPSSPRPPASSGGAVVTNPQRKILSVVAMLQIRGLEPSRDRVARWLGIHPKGGSYGINLGFLRSEGFLNDFALTDAGRPLVDYMPTGLAGALEPLSTPQRTILSLLNRAHQQDSGYTRDSLAEALGIHPKGGSYGINLARLRTMGLIPEKGEIRLTEGALR